MVFLSQFTYFLYSRYWFYSAFSPITPPRFTCKEKRVSTFAKKILCIFVLFLSYLWTFISFIPHDTLKNTNSVVYFLLDNTKYILILASNKMTSNGAKAASSGGTVPTLPKESPSIVNT